MNDPRERLRRYLEQRRELGESEFVLDSLSVEDALKVLAFGAPPPTDAGAPRGPGAPPQGGATASGAPPQHTPAATGARAQPDRPIPPAADSAKRRAAEEAAKGGDWREALRAVDAGDGSPTSEPASREKKGPAAKQASAEPFASPMAPASGPRSAPRGASTSAPPSAPPDGVALTVGTDAVGSGLENLLTLDDVARSIAGCTACDLYATACNPVPGEGNPAAKFVVVGEAPGATEDELGRPFVGRSGDLLTKILEAIGFKREDVFICNVLKHRPPGNRNPTAGEIAACRPYLLRQLEILEPRVVLALGTFAAQTLLATNAPIGRLRGIEHTYHGIPLIATYHPAAMLRNPNWKRPAWEDVQFARRIFDRA